MRHHLQHVHINDELLEGCTQPAFKPTGGVLDDLRTAHDRAPKRHLRFPGCLRINAVRRIGVGRSEWQVVTPAELAGATVTARVLGETKGKKIDGFTYKNKTNQSRRWGHRQRYTTIEITDITKG